MIEFKRLGKNDVNIAVFKNGKHVDALVRLMGETRYCLWKNKELFSASDLRQIADRLDALNGEE